METSNNLASVYWLMSLSRSCPHAGPHFPHFYSRIIFIAIPSIPSIPLLVKIFSTESSNTFGLRTYSFISISPIRTLMLS